MTFQSRGRAVAKSALASSPHPLMSLIGKSPYLSGSIVAVALLGLSAFANHRLAKKAEKDTPPRGRFLDIDGVRLHVSERGQGEPLVLLHGNGTSIEDFASSGLIDKAAARHRVIAFDRPGFGHSTRPGGAAWTDVAQADLIAAALAKMGVTRAVVLGHSWGASVAMALALNHPDKVSALVLVSGYYYPTARTDAVASAALLTPIVGDVVRHAISPLLSRVTWPLLLRKLFGPAPAPPKFDAFPKEMTFRPSQIGASAADAAMMIPDAIARSGRYGELKMPIVIIAGEKDRLVDIDAQSGRLHADLPRSTLRRVPGAGHMVHQTATDAVMEAIEEAARLAGEAALTVPPSGVAEMAHAAE